MLVYYCGHGLNNCGDYVFLPIFLIFFTEFAGSGRTPKHQPSDLAPRLRQWPDMPSLAEFGWNKRWKTYSESCLGLCAESKIAGPRGPDGVMVQLPAARFWVLPMAFLVQQSKLNTSLDHLHYTVYTQLAHDPATV